MKNEVLIPGTATPDKDFIDHKGRHVCCTECGAKSARMKVVGYTDVRYGNSPRFGTPLSEHLVLAILVCKCGRVKMHATYVPEDLK